MCRCGWARCCCSSPPCCGSEGRSDRMKIRPATEADLPGIFAIYDREVLHGTATFDTEPKTGAERLAWLRDDAKGKYPILVAEIDGAIAGWARLYAWSNRCAYAPAAENAVYVHQDQ